ncbi:cysteine protease [Penicillium verhagenii]|uniref:cysteine protease n=1 Tax=Penicillium verhagenii TaxID=1562060 RepID=UPI00254580AA|nr:cysteine protease [Penicillium verhagenii]KAJ5923913.1 cysteine protease [Penicillium verhagenii]
MGTPFSKPDPVTEKAPIAKMSVTRSSQSTEEEHTEYPPPSYPVRERIQTLAPSHVKDWNETLLSDSKNRLAISSFATQPYASILTNQRVVQSDLQIFNLTVPIEGAPITNQRSSGRCWLFASTNVFRVPLMKAYQLKEFELSQAYLYYWDKIEKANWFFEQIIATADQDLSSRLVQKLYEDPVTDGGQWDMVANLVQKYGLVPHALYPDAYHAQNSSKLNWLLTAKLREQALALRKLAAKKADPKSAYLLSVSKDKFLQEVHSLVTLLLGPAPSPDKPFVWQYYDANGTAREVRKTPVEFGQQALRSQTRAACRSNGAALSPARFFSLVNDPRNEYNRLLTVDRLGNIVEGQPITYVNVEMPVLKRAVIAMLKAGHPVFFGCDVGKFSDTTLGIMDPELTDLTLGFNVSLGMNKAERLASGESSMTHAMVITAVHLENDEPVRWRVENSWGQTAGDKGWFVMTDRWMDEYTFQAVVDSNFVSSEVRAILGQTAIVLPRWDPMGVLA